MCCTDDSIYSLPDESGAIEAAEPTPIRTYCEVITLDAVRYQCPLCGHGYVQLNQRMVTDIRAGYIARMKCTHGDCTAALEVGLPRVVGVSSLHMAGGGRR